MIIDTRQFRNVADKAVLLCTAVLGIFLLARAARAEVVVLSGLFEPSGNMKTIGERISRRIMERLPKQCMGNVEVEANGGGGPGPESWMAGRYSKFVERKMADPQSCEQFVVIGFSDGATAIWRRHEELLQGEPSPAYIGFIDMVRLNYWNLFSINGVATTPAEMKILFAKKARGEELTWNEKSQLESARVIDRKYLDKGTVFNNYYQTYEGMKGRYIHGANNFQTDRLLHLQLPRDEKIKLVIVEAAADAYLKRVFMEVDRRGSIPWPASKAMRQLIGF